MYVDRRAATLRVAAGVGLDLGGIAKGWLADAVVRRLQRYGAALADLGGDIALGGTPPAPDAWEIDVANPRDDARVLGRLRLRGGGVATSGVLGRRWVTANGIQHHIIDPRTGHPTITDLLTVTVAAPSATTAEVAAKAALLLGVKEGCRALAMSDHLAGVLMPVQGPPLVIGAFGDRTGVFWEPEP